MAAALAPALLLLPGAAAARVVQAVTILPPGQSGVVDDPHVFDQLPLFQRLEYQPEPFGAMVSAEVQGLAIPPPIPLQNRGTFELAVELGR